MNMHAMIIRLLDVSGPRPRVVPCSLWVHRFDPLPACVLVGLQAPPHRGARAGRASRPGGLGRGHQVRGAHRAPFADHRGGRNQASGRQDDRQGRGYQEVAERREGAEQGAGDRRGRRSVSTAARRARTSTRRPSAPRRITSSPSRRPSTRASAPRQSPPRRRVRSPRGSPSARRSRPRMTRTRRRGPTTGRRIIPIRTTTLIGPNSKNWA